MGMKALLVSASDCASDYENKVYSTPAYMEKTDIASLNEGIKKVVESIAKAL